MFKGDENGAAVYIEKALNKKLIWFPCRHHIYELVLKSVAEVVWPVSCGPSPAVFNRFKREWSTIDQSQYETGMDDQSVKQILCEKKTRYFGIYSISNEGNLKQRNVILFLYHKYHQQIDQSNLIILGIST